MAKNPTSPKNPTNTKGPTNAKSPTNAKGPKKSRKQQGGTPATVALSDAGVDFAVHSYTPDPAHPSYGQEAAEAMGVTPERVFKTLVAEVDGELTVAVVPVSGSLDLKALAAAIRAAGAGAGKRAVMADPAQAERTTGYVRGGISPLGQRKRLRTVVDSSAEGHATICVSAGRRGLEVEVAPADLVALTGAVLADIGRG